MTVRNWLETYRKGKSRGHLAKAGLPGKCVMINKKKLDFCAVANYVLMVNK